MSKLEQALEAAEDARATLDRAALDTAPGWEDRFADAEREWTEAEYALRYALRELGVPVDRVVEVLR